MPIRSEKKGRGWCWSDRSRLERLLICVLSVTIVTLIVLLVLVIKRPGSHTNPEQIQANTCATPTCVGEAAKILRQIDPNVNPCDDFYRFACGGFQKKSHGDENLNLLRQLEAQTKRELLKIYVEEIRDDEHKMVKIAKKLFKKCMNQTEIDVDGLKTIKQALNEAGGWPVLDGRNWDERRFDWFRATFKFRQLGYPYNFFLDLQIQPDKENKEKHIFKVVTADTTNEETLKITSSTSTNEEMECEMERWRRIPECEAIFAKLNRPRPEPNNDAENLEKMIEVATIFGTSQFTDEVAREMNDVNIFWRKLKESIPFTDKDRVRVENFQQNYGTTFDWLKFINVVAGPKASIAKKDFVLFQTQDHLKDCLKLISETPKRTLANYMMWRVVEQQLPYLTKTLQNLPPVKDEQETRADFCARTISERFTPNPVEIMWNRKYLSAGKKSFIEDISPNFKSEMLDTLKDVDWLEESTKNKAIERLKKLKMVFGQPENIFDDKLLDALDVDLNVTNKETFLGLLGAVSKNHQSSLYNRIKKTGAEPLYEKWYYKSNVLNYDVEDNTFFIPTSLLGLFNERNPNYLAYSKMKHVFAVILSYLLEEIKPIETLNHKIVEHLTGETANDTNVKWNQLLHQFLTQTTIDKIADDAYEKWTRKNGEEQKLLGIEFTPRQLMWISSVDCLTANPYSTFKSTTYALRNTHVTLTAGVPTKYLAFITNTFSKFTRNNTNFVHDFHCPATN